MRNLIHVLNRIIDIAPDLEDHFVSLKSSIAYSAPELMAIRWQEAAYILNSYAENHPEKEKIAAIFSDNE